VGNQTSNMIAQLGGPSAAPVWEKEVLAAFATWSRYANFNIGVVADSGLPLGSSGAIQGDARFGDIRIAGSAMASDVIAVASPFDLRAGTWSGDIEFNTSLLANNPNLNLYQVALHEVGHALGLDESTNPHSPMFEDYLDRSPMIQPEDIEHIQALYGPRPQEAGPAINDSIATASNLVQSSAPGSQVQTADGDLGNSSDIDFYRLKLSGQPGPVSVTLQTAGLSLLQASLSIVDGSGKGLARRDEPDTGPD